MASSSHDGHEEALVDLLNSRSYATLPDKFDVPELAEEVLRPFGGGPVSELVRAVRDDLVGLVAADPQDSAADWAAFTGRTSSVAFQQDFSTPGEVRLRQVSGDPVVGSIVRTVAAVVEAGNWPRLKLCANDICREVFYDTTRSRTRRWHSYDICGNRTNVAAYRARNVTTG